MCAVDLEPLLDCFFLVVFALDQGFTGNVVHTGHLGRVELDVIGAARRRVRAASAHAVDDGLKRNVDFQHVVERHASSFHGISLGDGARESVKQETIGAVGLGDAVFHQVDDQIVADQTARGHDCLGLQPQRRSGLDRCTQHVAGGNLRNAVFLANESGLGAFAGAWCAQKNQSHGLTSIKRKSCAPVEVLYGQSQRV